MMLAEVERLGREHKCSGIDIKVVSLRTDLIAWYTSQGYEQTGVSPYPPENVHKLTRAAHFVDMRRFLHCGSGSGLAADSAPERRFDLGVATLDDAVAVMK